MPLAHPLLTDRLWKTGASSIVFALLTLFLTGCPEGFDFDEPQILSLTVDPSSISRSEVGMTDEFFTVQISLLNFDEDIEEVSVFIQEPYREAVPQEVVDMGDIIELRGIAKTWFSDYSPGVYNIGALIRTETIRVRENNLATVTVTE